MASVDRCSDHTEHERMVLEDAVSTELTVIMEKINA